MASTSQVIHTLYRALTAAGWTLSAACSPLTATIGYDEPADGALAPELDAAPGLDDSELPGSDAGGPHDAALAPDEDARAAVRCWHLPDVVNPHNEAGIETVEEGDVYGATDKALACDAGMNVVTPAPAPGTPRNDPVSVTYERGDGMPLMRGGYPYSLTIPSTTFVGIAGFAGPRCEQAPLRAMLLTFNLTTGPCVDVNPLLDSQGLRLNLTEQTLLPMGSTLCDANCKDVPRP